MIATGFTVSSITRRAMLLAGAAAFALSTGCAAEDDIPGRNYPDQSNQGAVTEVPPRQNASRGCLDGGTRSCQIVVGVHNGVKTCVVGKSVCEKGRWAACTLDDA